MSQTEPPPMDDVRRLVAQYDQSARPRDPDLLRQAARVLRRVDLLVALSTEQRQQQRAEVLGLWVGLLRRLDLARDARFDPHDGPSTRVYPPAPKNGRAYPPNVEPQAVQDPADRASYEQALEDNEAKRQRAARHWALDAVDQEVSDNARAFVQRFYTDAPLDRQALKAAIDDGKLAPARVQALLKAR